ncbi:MAG: serine hydrolase domain-containing protein [Pyrinomonadaceae bacterium]
MRPKFRSLNLFFLAIVLVPSVLAQKPAREEKPDFGPIKTELQKKVADGTLPSVSIGVTKNGKTLWLESFGYADIGKKVPATPDTIYALGSLSKSITATAVYRLVQDGKIDLDQPIGRYLRSVTIDHRGRDPATYKVFHLLNMAAGIPHYWRYCYTSSGPLDKCRDELLGRASFSAFSPGAVHTYSNLSLGLAAQMVADVSGEPLSMFMRRKIFGPARMKNTFTHVSEIPANRTAIAQPYRADGGLADSFQFEPAGGGGYYSTVNDLLRYGSMHLETRGRAERVLRYEIQRENHRVREGLPHEFYANGWGVLPLANGRRTLLSNGAIEGAASTLLVLPESGIVIVVLINKSVGNDVSDDIAFRIAGSLLPGYKKDLDSLFERVGPSFGFAEFSADSELEGAWVGTVNVMSEKVPLEITFSGSSAALKLDTLATVNAALRRGQGIITFSADIPGAGKLLRSSTDQVTFQARLEGGKLVGSVQTEILTPRPEYLLAFPFTAAKK